MLAAPLIRPTTINTDNVPSHRIHLVPHIDSLRIPSLQFIFRDIRDGDPPLRLCRYTDPSGIGLGALAKVATDKVTFKSKVVSRAHAEIWSDNGKFYIKDTKSSSGTFLNELRLSPAGSESKPYQLMDGDIVQLGVDYQGSTECIYKSVKLIIEVGGTDDSEKSILDADATGRPNQHLEDADGLPLGFFDDSESHLHPHPARRRRLLPFTVDLYHVAEDIPARGRTLIGHVSSLSRRTYESLHNTLPSGVASERFFWLVPQSK
ncbi:hypothetical protein M405DRAFT_358711 [Rhizopogon salebrosus TDB-379]|nr:hypothetical protein M405DRAFT_358711 [Rhizopogon salebrosus TDB-379]